MRSIVLTLLVAGTLPAAEFYENGVRQTLSRWPNETKTTMRRVLDRGDSPRAPGARRGTFVFRGDRPARWAEAAQAGQLWLAGFWRVAWEWETVRVKTLDLAQSTIEFSQPVYGGIGSKYAGPEGAGTEQWIALNLLEEIDRPGEWSIDFATQTLFWWPSAPIESAEIAVADFDGPMVRLHGASHVALRGLVITGGLGNGVEITGGLRHQVLSCDLDSLGHSGIVLGGGDRPALTPAGHVADIAQKVPGFPPIPFADIGLYVNELRPVLPKHPAGTSRPSWRQP